LRIGCGPCGLGGVSIGDGLLDFGMLGECDLGLHLAGVGIENVAESPRSPFNRLATDKMADLTHGRTPRLFQGPKPDYWAFDASSRRFLQLFARRSQAGGLFRAVFLSPMVSLYPVLTAPV